MKVGFCSLGCKVNAYETEYAINEFKKRGYEIVSFDDYADVYVVNTCSVTNASDQKSRKMLMAIKPELDNKKQKMLDLFVKVMEIKTIMEGIYGK